MHKQCQNDFDIYHLVGSCRKSPQATCSDLVLLLLFFFVDSCFFDLILQTNPVDKNFIIAFFFGAMTGSHASVSFISQQTRVYQRAGEVMIAPKTFALT